MDRSEARARMWGGLALGVILAVIGLVLGLSSGWTWTAIPLCVGGLVIAVGQTIWILVARARRNRTSNRPM